MGSRTGTAPAPHVDGDPFWGLARSRRRGPLPAAEQAAALALAPEWRAHCSLASMVVADRPSVGTGGVGGGAKSDDHCPGVGANSDCHPHRPARRGGGAPSAVQSRADLRMATHTPTRRGAEWPELAGPPTPRHPRLAKPRSRRGGAVVLRERCLSCGVIDPGAQRRRPPRTRQRLARRGGPSAGSPLASARR